MSKLLTPLSRSPVLARVAPFALFVILTFLQDFTGPSGKYWIYTLKTVIGAWMIWLVRPMIAEMRWKLSGAAITVGVAVFIMWIGLDKLFVWLGCPHSYPKLQLTGSAWVPHAVFGAGMAWFFNLVRIAGSTLVVPPLEEVFFRSFLYRYLAKADFLAMPLGKLAWGPFIVASVFFGLGHREWLAGILCGLAYQGLVCWKNRLGDAITAHAITNALLGGWVVATKAWQFW